MDEHPCEDAGEQSLSTTFACLAHGGRRRLLRHLSERGSEPVSRQGLADVLAAHTNDKPPGAVTGEERQDALVALHHEHLPSLTAAGFVEPGGGDDTVALAEHPALRDSGIVEAVEGDASGSEESLDVLFRALADGRRRTILDVLSHQFGEIHVETLARELEADERDVAESEVSEADVEGALLNLHHVDLPHLSEAGLVEYDTDEQMVAYGGHPDLRVPWMHSVFESEFRSSLTGESAPSGIGELEDRERVISYGQSLCDRADEELFCMFTDTGLLEAGCLTRIRDAAQERDVDVYLGTCDPAIREYVEANAPEVVLWEPDADWLNLPVADDRVGRLLLADREAVMLGTLLEQEAGDRHGEQAIVGEGDHNTLVTMIRQLLGPRLETIGEDGEHAEPALTL